MKEWPAAFDFDHISLAPRVISEVAHRGDARPETSFGPLQLQIPILGSPMPDVVGVGMARALAQHGALGILHRFDSIEDQTAAFRASSVELVHSVPPIGAAVGVSGDYQARFNALYQAGCRIICLDTANGAHRQVAAAIVWIKKRAGDVFLIAGNVATGEAFRWLEGEGADAIRVGIAGGSVCETRNETGVYVPTPYAVAEAASVRSRALIVGDGGVRMPADLCKLLALGADVVMLGSALAGTREALGRVVAVDGKRYKIMRGAASFSVQQEASASRPQYVEGAETLVPYKGRVEEVLQRYLAGLRSSMSYLNAKTLADYRRNASFVQVAPVPAP
ncbi:MAG TPA: guanosine monophosphate reductase [Candidatus Acidoferrum sp.]|nr:guanosine monophosphate reductase [Candidatus Acidoferrum sp.]